MTRHVLTLLTLFSCASTSIVTNAQQTAVDFFDNGITKSKPVGTDE